MQICISVILNDSLQEIADLSATTPLSLGFEMKELLHCRAMKKENTFTW